MKRLLILLCFSSGATLAQDHEQAVQRALMQRQQQLDEFVLQLRQSQQRLQLAPGDLTQQQALESQHLQQRHSLENLGAQQQLSIGQGTQGDKARLISERQRADRERQTELQRGVELRLPPPQSREAILPRL